MSVAPTALYASTSAICLGKPSPESGLDPVRTNTRSPVTTRIVAPLAKALALEIQTELHQ